MGKTSAASACTRAAARRRGTASAGSSAGLDVELAGRHGVERQAGAFQLRGDGGGGGVDDPRGQLAVARAAGPDDGRVARGRGRGGGGQAIERLTARAIPKEAGDHARERLERVLLFVQHGRHGGHAVVVDSLCHA